MDRMLTFMNLLAVAAADRQLTEREIKFLTKRARELKLSDHQYNLAMNHALAQPGEVRIPRRKADREDLLRDMLRVMAADGELADVEKQLFAVVAAYMKFDKAKVDSLIDEVLAAELETPPTKSPAKTPGKSPAKSPTKTTSKSPTKTTSKSPTKTTSKSPAKSPTKSPTKTAARSTERRKPTSR